MLVGHLIAAQHELQKFVTENSQEFSHLELSKMEALLKLVGDFITHYKEKNKRELQQPQRS